MAYSKQTWDTSSYVNPTRMNHIEDGIESASTATGTAYDSNTSVKDKIDSKANSSDFVGLKVIHRAESNQLETVYIDANYHTYLVTCFGGGGNLQVAIASFRSNSDYTVQHLIGSGVTSNGYKLEFGYTAWHVASVIQLA